MRWLPALTLFVALSGATPVLAVQPDEVLPDPALEGRARNLSRELRCMVCQNQSIDDSDAPLARDLRLLVRERLQAGDSDQQILNFLTARYGEFVLLKPPFGLHTALLWLLPAGFLAIGAFALVMLVRRSRQNAGTDTRLSPAEQARLAEVANPRGHGEP